MTHDNFTEKLSLWLDNQLNQAEVTQLQAHLAHCPTCAQVYQAMQQVDGLLRCAAVTMAEPQPGFNGRFEARLAQQQEVKHGRLWAGLGVLLVGTLLVAALVAIAGATLISISTNRLNLWMLYTMLGALGRIVNQVHTCVNLGSFFFKVIWLAMQQPLFWGFVAVAITLAGLWSRVIYKIYHRIPATLALSI